MAGWGLLAVAVVSVGPMCLPGAFPVVVAFGQGKSCLRHVAISLVATGGSRVGSSPVADGSVASDWWGSVATFSRHQHYLSLWRVAVVSFTSWEHCQWAVGALPGAGKRCCLRSRQESFLASCWWVVWLSGHCHYLTLRNAFVHATMPLLPMRSPCSHPGVN